MRGVAGIVTLAASLACGEAFRWFKKKKKKKRLRVAHEVFDLFDIRASAFLSDSCIGDKM